MSNIPVGIGMGERMTILSAKSGDDSVTESTRINDSALDGAEPEEANDKRYGRDKPCENSH